MKTFPVEDYRYFVGKGLQELIRSVMPEDKVNDKIVDDFLSEMKTEYAERWNKNSKPYPGIPELLDELQRIGLPMAVLSNKADDFTKIMVKTLLPKWHFQVVRGLKEGIPPKPDPTSALQIAREMKIQPSDFMYIGDTDIDMQTATSAGMYPVGALWGFRTAEELKENGAKVLVETPPQVLEMLEL